MSYGDFLADRKTQDAVTRNIEIIGEAACALPDEFTDRHADSAWSEIVAMRNVIVHQYFGVLPEVIVVNEATGESMNLPLMKAG